MGCSASGYQLCSTCCNNCSPCCDDSIHGTCGHNSCRGTSCEDGILWSCSSGDHRIHGTCYNWLHCTSDDQCSGAHHWKILVMAHFDHTLSIDFLHGLSMIFFDPVRSINSFNQDSYEF